MTEDTFGSLVQVSITAGVVTEKDLAGQFEVAPSTVGRWIRGTARPIPSIQRRVIEHILNRVVTSAISDPLWSSQRLVEFNELAGRLVGFQNTLAKRMVEEALIKLVS